jgi:SAM-dependent methyltransferase
MVNKMMRIKNGILNSQEYDKDKPTKITHPAKYSDVFIPIFAGLLSGYNHVLDPMAGTGKIAKIKDLGWCGEIVCNDLEPDWKKPEYGVDRWYHTDAASMSWARDGEFNAICTSPTYGNRLADHWQRREFSQRQSYFFNLGHALHAENTGMMHWGSVYQAKHKAIYQECIRVLCHGGVFVLNISDHIRNKEVIPVVAFHRILLESLGLRMKEDREFSTSRLRYGQNHEARVEHEHILIFEKIRG